MQENHKMHYTKPALSLDQQIELLKKRGLCIFDEEKAKEFLRQTGYFRLTGYFKYYQNIENNQFYDWITFEQITNLYAFDERLRELALQAIAKIEVSLKAQLDIMSIQYGCFWYTNEQHFALNDEKSKEIYSNFINIAKEKKEKATSTFWKAYREKYNKEDFLPSRMLLEECMIGEVVNLYKLLNIKDSKQIASNYATYFVDLRKRLQLIVNVRNISAHCARLRNRIFIIRPRTEDVIFKTSYPQEIGGNGKLEVISNFFTFTLITNYLLQQIVSENLWLKKLEELFNEFPNVTKNIMGFCDDWKEKIK